MSLKVRALAGVKWTSLSSIVVAVLQLSQLAVLARYLAPSDFGLMAIVSVVIGFSALFMDMGISSAIIHKRDITESQLSSLYWMNICAGIILALIVYISAPFIALFYDEILLSDLIRLLAPTFIFSSIGNQYRILYQKELFFDKLAKVEIISSLIAFVIAVLCAMKGFGVYSLVYAALSKVASANAIFFIRGIKKHKPKFHYNYNEIKGMIGFGLFQMGERSINYFNSQFDTILIGKLLGTESLGIYTIAKTLVMRPAQIINPIITKVTFPIMARVQNDKPQLRNIYLKTINYLCSINIPIYIALAVLAEPVVNSLFGENWGAAIVLVQILSVHYILRSIGNPIGSLQLAKGRADLGFYWNSLLFVFYPISIYLGSFYGVEGVAYSLVLLSMLFTIPNWYFMVRPLCGASFLGYFKMIFLPLLIAIISSIFSFFIIPYIAEEQNVILNALLFMVISFLCNLLGFVYVNKRNCS
jgi:O-antigen/teichoic acid export membrane protein